MIFDVCTVRVWLMLHSPDISGEVDNGELWHHLWTETPNVILCILMMLQSIIVMLMNSGDFFTVLQAACNFVLIMTSLGGDEDGDYIITRYWYDYHVMTMWWGCDEETRTVNWRQTSQRAVFRLRGARLEKLLHHAHDDDDGHDGDGHDNGHDGDDGDGGDDGDDNHLQRQSRPIHSILPFLDRTVNHWDQKRGASRPVLQSRIFHHHKRHGHNH